MSKLAVFKGLLRFITRQKFWLLPLVIVLVLLGLLLAFAQSSALAPFIYTLF